MTVCGVNECARMPRNPHLPGLPGKGKPSQAPALSIFFFLPSPPYPCGRVKALLSSARLEVEAAYILREEAGRTARPVPSPHPCLAGCGRAEGTGQGGQGREGLRCQTTRPPREEEASCLPSTQAVSQLGRYLLACLDNLRKKSALDPFIVKKPAFQVSFDTCLEPALGQDEDGWGTKMGEIHLLL